MAKKTKPVATSAKPKMVNAVRFDGLKDNQRFNVGEKRSFAAGEVCPCQLDAKKKPKDEALAAALKAKVASLTQVPDPAAAPEETN